MFREVEDRADCVTSDISSGGRCDTKSNAMRRLIGTDTVESEMRIAILVHLHEHTCSEYQWNRVVMQTTIGT